VLVGNSFGGHVALRIAHKRPDLVRGWCSRARAACSSGRWCAGRRSAPRDWVKEKIEELFYDKNALDESDIDRAHEVLNTRQGARAMVRLSRTARRNHLGDVLGDIATPTLLIWGREDVVTPPSAAQGFHDLMPDTELVWVERCGHTPMLEAPQVFADALLGFAARVYADRGAG
jgi:2-hydroxy-6-oxonona-2,4-dienedioate hydrolase